MPEIDENVFPEYEQERFDKIINSGGLGRGSDDGKTTRANLKNAFYELNDVERREAIGWIINQISTQSRNHKVALCIIADDEQALPDRLDTNWIRELIDKSDGDMTLGAAASLVRHGPELTNFEVKQDGSYDYDLLSVFLYHNDHRHVQRWAEEGGSFRTYELRRAAAGANFGTESLDIVLNNRPGRPKQLYKALKAYAGRYSARYDPSATTEISAVIDRLEQAGMPTVDHGAFDELPGTSRSLTGQLIEIAHEGGDTNRTNKEKRKKGEMLVKKALNEQVPLTDPGADFLHSEINCGRLDYPKLAPPVLKLLLRRDYYPSRQRLKALLQDPDYSDIIENNTRGRKLKAVKTGRS